MMRRVPPASPGIAASQKSCMVSNLKPMKGRRTTTAEITNHVANEKISDHVVIHSTRHEIFFPSVFQKTSFSGSHFLSHVVAIEIKDLVYSFSVCSFKFFFRMRRCLVSHLHNRTVHPPHTDYRNKEKENPHTGPHTCPVQQVRE